jgi:hypothetical protein
MPIKLTKNHVKPIKICYVACVSFKKKNKKKNNKKITPLSKIGLVDPKEANPPNKLLRVGFLEEIESSLMAMRWFHYPH